MTTPFCSLPEVPGIRRRHILKRTLAGAVTLGCVAISSRSTFAQSWTTTTAPIANWVSVASSADGNKLAALVQGGEAVYTSTNAGATWTLSSLANGGTQGDSIACSADGSILFVSGNTQVFRSTNSGATWNPGASPSENWTAVACSTDGTQVAGTSAIRRGSTAGIFTSSDEGATWTFSTAPSETWLAIASSADGGKLVGVDASADAIYTSTDAGNTWSQHSPPLQAFSSVASSADGTRLVAASGISALANGPIFVSTNSGLDWTQTTAPITNWVTVASSADGSALIAAGGGESSLGHLFLSTDAGTTWNQTNALLTHWRSAAVSADGTKFVAADYGGHIYSLHLSPFTLSPLLGTRASGGNVVISWLVPTLNFVLQQNSDLTTSNWTDLTAPPVLNTANLHNEVTVPNIGANAYYRLLSGTGSTNGGLQAIANVLLGPWQTLVVDTLFTPTFNADGTFTATIQPPLGAITTDSGTWGLTPPLVPSGFTNPQGHLALTNGVGTVLLSGDVLLINPDQLLMTSATDSVSTTTFVPQLIISKVTP
jgi:hypothetical protein